MYCVYGFDVLENPDDRILREVENPDVLFVRILRRVENPVVLFVRILREFENPDI